MLMGCPLSHGTRRDSCCHRFCSRPGLLHAEVAHSLPSRCISGWRTGSGPYVPPRPAPGPACRGGGWTERPPPVDSSWVQPRCVGALQCVAASRLLLMADMRPLGGVLVDVFGRGYPAAPAFGDGAVIGAQPVGAELMPLRGAEFGFELGHGVAFSLVGSVPKNLITSSWLSDRSPGWWRICQPPITTTPIC